MENPLSIANYFLEKSFDTGVEVTPMKLLKLVYIAHGWHLGIKGTPIINEAVQAWKYGPIVESVYHQFKEYGNQSIKRLASTFNDDWQYITPVVEDEETKSFLDRVWNSYGKFNGLQLSTLTHQENTPWDIVWNRQGGKDKSGTIIPNDLIQAHYKEKMNG